MTELLSILYKMRIFTLDELSEALKGKVKSVDALLARYKQQGWIVDTIQIRCKQRPAVVLFN